MSCILCYGFFSSRFKSTEELIYGQLLGKLNWMSQYLFLKYDYVYTCTC